jgi:glycosyltransferase involved in cell wall biosynthesis
MVRIAILRREPNVSFSMDVYANGLASGLKAVRPQWDIINLQPNDIRSIANPWLAGLQKYYQRYWQYPRLAQKSDVDLFHIIDHSDGHLAYWLPKTGKPVVVTCHDLINFLQPENISDQARLAFVSRVIWKYAVSGIRQASHIIAVSQHTAKDVTDLLGVDCAALTPVPNGVDSAFRPLPADEIATIRQQYKISPDQFCLLHVGSNHPRKNVLAVLEVLKRLRSQGKKVCLIKAGATFSQTQAAFIEENNLSTAITHVTKPTKETLVELYNAADALLSPSLYEGFGITLLEAMACDTPIITSNVTSLPEVVGAAGMMVNPRRVDEIAQAVIQLIKEDDYRQQLIEKGRARVKTFTWENTAEQVAQVYEKLLDKRP